jgi:uncharacterized protein
VPEISTASLAALAALVFLAGFVDSLAGGGGLITLPAYLSVGVPPALVLGTNKLSSSIGTVVSAVRFWRASSPKIRDAAPVVACALAGSALGAKLALLLDPAWLKPILLGALPFVVAAVLSAPRFGHADETASLGRRAVLLRSMAIALPIGCYDGFFGPGTGTFFALALTLFSRCSLLQATTQAKVLNLASNVAALGAFLHAGRVDVRLGAAMGMMSVAGHYAGSSVGIKGGAKVIRPMLAVVCAGLFLKILADVSR